MEISKSTLSSVHLQPTKLTKAENAWHITNERTRQSIAEAFGNFADAQAWEPRRDAITHASSTLTS